MKYVKAQNVLPAEVIRIIQQYVDGEFIYVPRKEGSQKAWGEKSGARDSLKERNSRIYAEYTSGIKVSELSRSYYLSEQSVRRILSQEKSRCSNSLHNGL